MTIRAYRIDHSPNTRFSRAVTSIMQRANARALGSFTITDTSVEWEYLNTPAASRVRAKVARALTIATSSGMTHRWSTEDGEA